MRHGFRYNGTGHWTMAHRGGLDLKLTHPGQQFMLQEYINAEQEAGQRVERLTEQIRELVNSWRMAPVAERLGRCGEYR
jgi:hypothetical protein